MACKCYHADKNFLGKIGVCWGTKECEACSCGGDESKCDFYEYVRERAKKPITNANCNPAYRDEQLTKHLNWWHNNLLHETLKRLHEKKPTTNADYIRGMSDEELAKYLYWHDNSPICASFERWLEWLKMEKR